MNGVTEATVALFRAKANVGLGRRWHVVGQRTGFILVAPLPCGFVQATIQCDEASLARLTIAEGDVAALERKLCRHCITAVRAQAA